MLSRERTLMVIADRWIAFIGIPEFRIVAEDVKCPPHISELLSTTRNDLSNFIFCATRAAKFFSFIYESPKTQLKYVINLFES